MQIGKIRPGQMPLAREWNALAETYNGGSFGRNGTGQRSRVRIVGKNTSGTDRSRFECMKVEGVTTDLTADGQVDLVFELKAGTSDGPTAILVDPIEDDQFGQIILDGLAIAKVDSGTASYEYAVASSNGDLTPQEDPSDIRLLSSPDPGATTYLPVLLGVGTGGGDSFFLYTLTSTMGASTGTATIRNLADTEQIATGVSLSNTLGHFTGLASGRRGLCVKDGSTYRAVSPYLVDVRWDDPDLEQSKDGTNYTNIDTTEEC